MSNLAPIVLFVYNRPDHTLRTLEALQKNEGASESELFVFADGAKQDATSEGKLRIKETRAVVYSQKWCRKVTMVESEENKGLAASIIAGVTKIVNEYGKIIVLEDDLVTSPYFLKYMNNALDAYENNMEVACISGYIYPVKTKLPEVFFIKGADCWGWAAWKHSWELFERDGSKLLAELHEKNLTSEFDFEDSYPYTRMLEDQIHGRNNSWAIRWYASAFLKNKLCLYPGVSLVQNIGIDGSGTHSGVSDKWEVELAKKSIDVNIVDVKEDLDSKKKISNYFNSIYKSNPSILRRIIRKLNSFRKNK